MYSVEYPESDPKRFSELLPDIDAVAVGIGEDEAAQAIRRIAQTFDDAHRMRDEVIV